MIKFFRKIRQNLLSEGKTGKYFKYAIGEILLVVIGILIALQINNWNENRKNEDKELAHLTGIRHELKAQIINLENVVKVNESSLRIIENVMNNYIENDGFKNNDSLLYKFSQLLKSPVPSEIKTSFTEMLQSGEVKLISDDSLRNHIIKFYQNLDAKIKKANQNTIGVHNSSIIPVIQRNTVLDKANLMNGVGVDFALDLEKIKYSERTKSIAFNNLQIQKEELAMVNALNLKAAVESLQLKRSKVLIEEANKLIVSINKVIN